MNSSHTVPSSASTGEKLQSYLTISSVEDVSTLAGQEQNFTLASIPGQTAYLHHIDSGKMTGKPLVQFSVTYLQRFDGMMFRLDVSGEFKRPFP